MATTVKSVEYADKLTIKEQLSATNMPGVAATRREVLHNQYDTTKSYTATSSPAVTKVAQFSQALSGGSATIDLTSLTDSEGNALDLTGLKCQAARFRNPSTNTGAITITEGAVNGFALGGASFSWILQPGQAITIDGANVTDAVGASDLAIDLAGTGSEALEVSLAFGS